MYLFGGFRFSEAIVQKHSFKMANSQENTGGGEMKKEFIVMLTTASIVFGLPLLAKTEVFNFPGPVIVEENPLSIVSATWTNWIDGAELNGLRSQPFGDPYSPLNEGDIIFKILASGYQGEDFIKTASISFQATENFSTEGTGTCIRFRTTENGMIDDHERMRIDHNGNVGIGTNTPQSTLQVAGYVQLALTDGDPPPEADCDDSSEYGRMMVDQINSNLYICVEDGWNILKGKNLKGKKNK